MKIKNLLAVPAFIATAASLAACGGGAAGGPAALPTAAPIAPSKPAQANAKSSITLRIPLGGKDVSAPSLHGRAQRPMFVDGGSNGTVKVFFDGTTVINYATNTGLNGATQSGSQALNTGGSFNWTSTIGLVNNQPVATITGTYTTVPGPHTIGAVQLNGTCVGPDPCIPNNQGYVLAEGQTTQLLQPGSNTAATLYLRGVMESVYICDPGCSGQNLTVDANGYYDLYVVAADENGTAITHQIEADGTTVLPFDNGTYSLQEQNPTGNGGNGILSIDKTGPFSTPGSDRANGGYGVNIKVKCTHTGTTTLVAKLDANGGTPSSAVNGFTVTPGTNYPTANMVLGYAGADLFYGNTLPLNCDSTGNLTIQ